MDEGNAVPVTDPMVVKFREDELGTDVFETGVTYVDCSAECDLEAVETIVDELFASVIDLDVKNCACLEDFVSADEDSVLSGVAVEDDASVVLGALVSTEK